MTDKIRLTKREREILLSMTLTPGPRFSPLKSMVNKLLKKNLVEYRYGYSNGYEITPLGRAALGEKP